MRVLVSVQLSEGNELMTMLLEKVPKVYRRSIKEHAPAARTANYREWVTEENEQRIMLLEKTGRFQI